MMTGNLDGKSRKTGWDPNRIVVDSWFPKIFFFFMCDLLLKQCEGLQKRLGNAHDAFWPLQNLAGRRLAGDYQCVLVLFIESCWMGVFLHQQDIFSGEYLPCEEAISIHIPQLKHVTPRNLHGIMAGTVRCWEIHIFVR